jgi:hypothetical protein
MPLAVALLESHVFPTYFFSYGSVSSSHTCSFFLQDAEKVRQRKRLLFGLFCLFG